MNEFVYFNTNLVRWNPFCETGTLLLVYYNIYGHRQCYMNELARSRCYMDGGLDNIDLHSGCHILMIRLWTLFLVGVKTLTVQKLPEKMTFFYKKNCQKIAIFLKTCPKLQFFSKVSKWQSFKNGIFLQFFSLQIF